MATYQYCEDSNRAAMPLGSSVISTHETAAGAIKAWNDEHRRFHNAHHTNRGRALPRVIVLVTSDGREYAVDQLMSAEEMEKWAKGY